MIKIKNLFLGVLVLSTTTFVSCKGSLTEENIQGDYIWKCGSSRRKIVIAKDNSIKIFNKDDWDYSKVNENMNVDDLPVKWKVEPWLDGKYRIDKKLIIYSAIGSEYIDTLSIGPNTLTEINDGTLGINYQMECFIESVYYKQ
jgi:hypothetical protein